MPPRWPTWPHGLRWPPGSTKWTDNAESFGPTRGRAWTRRKSCSPTCASGSAPIWPLPAGSWSACQSATFSLPPVWPTAMTSSPRCSPTTSPTDHAALMSRSTTTSSNSWMASSFRWGRPPELSPSECKPALAAAARAVPVGARVDCGPMVRLRTADPLRRLPLDGLGGWLLVAVLTVDALLVGRDVRLHFPNHTGISYWIVWAGVVAAALLVTSLLAYRFRKDAPWLRP